MENNKPKSISILTSQAFSLINFRGKLIQDIINSGVMCHALAPDFNENYRKQLCNWGARPVGITLKRASINPFRDIYDFFCLIKTLRKIKTDALLAYFIKPVIYGALAGRFAGIKKIYCIIEGAGYIYSEHDASHNYFRKLLRQLVTVLYKISLGQASVVIFLNPDDKRLFVNEIRVVKESRAVVINGIGVDLEYYNYTPPVNEPVTFILVARMLQYKGIREFAGAASRLREKYDNVRFLLVGGIDDNPASVGQDELKTWDDSGLLEWMGDVEDVRPHIAVSSVIVLPSYYREGLPRSLMEGMAMGRPVITTDTPGCRETVVPGENGYLVKPGDLAGLATAMDKFVQSPGRIEAMGRKSRSMAEQHFDVTRINRRFMEILGISP